MYPLTTANKTSYLRELEKSAGALTAAACSSCFKCIHRRSLRDVRVFVQSCLHVCSVSMCLNPRSRKLTNDSRMYKDRRGHETSLQYSPKNKPRFCHTGNYIYQVGRFLIDSFIHLVHSAVICNEMIIKDLSTTQSFLCSEVPCDVSFFNTNILQRSVAKSLTCGCVFSDVISRKRTTE